MTNNGISRYAIVDNATTIVQNVCVWDGSTLWTPPDGCESVLIPSNTIVNIGYLYIDGAFVPPPEPVEAP